MGRKQYPTDSTDAQREIIRQAMRLAKMVRTGAAKPVTLRLPRIDLGRGRPCGQRAGPRWARPLLRSLGEARFPRLQIVFADAGYQGRLEEPRKPVSHSRSRPSSRGRAPSAGCQNAGSWNEQSLGWCGTASAAASTRQRLQQDRLDLHRHERPHGPAPHARMTSLPPHLGATHRAPFHTEQL